jgi:UDP-glucose 4-epimerase
VYGRTTDVPTTEDHPTDPRSAYGAAKLAIEKYIQICMSLANVSAAIVRPANVYGPGQRSDRPQGAIAVFLDRLLRNLPIEVFGDGKIVRDYIHVRDVASAVRLLADHEPSGTWNVGSGIGYALNELIALIERTTERHVTVQYGPARAYDVPHNVLDATRLTQAVGWQPTISLESGIRMQFESLIGKPPTHAVAWRPDR